MLTIGTLKNNQVAKLSSNPENNEVQRRFEQATVARLLNSDEIRKAMVLLSKI